MLTVKYDAAIPIEAYAPIDYFIKIDILCVITYKKNFTPNELQTKCIRR
jgi:hypothetical protein